jgi:hypothetical protein
MAGLVLLNVPYKGTAPALTDLLGGQVDVMFISLVTGAAQVQGGKLRGYGVTSAQRQPSFPGLPAIGEIVKGFESTAWFGVFGPAQLSPEVTGPLGRIEASRVPYRPLHDCFAALHGSGCGSTKRRKTMSVTYVGFWG